MFLCPVGFGCTSVIWLLFPRSDVRGLGIGVGARSGVRFDRQEGQQWIQSLVLQSPDEAFAARELAVQAPLVGGGQALREASSLHQGSQDSGEERSASHGQEGRYQPGGLLG